MQVPVPEHWTVDQAIAVHELLEELLSAIWEVHGKAIGRRYELLALVGQEPRLAEPTDLDEADDIPF
jgi:hypothetical protein